MSAWRTYQPRNDPEGSAAERANQEMVRQGSQALFLAIVKAQAEREGRVDEFNAIVGGEA